MIELKLIWSPVIIDKIYRKHHVTVEEVEETIYDDKPLLRKGRLAGGTQRYYILGQTFAGKYLLIVLEKSLKNICTVITAREMIEAERKQYRKLI